VTGVQTCALPISQNPKTPQKNSSNKVMENNPQISYDYLMQCLDDNEVQFQITEKRAQTAQTRTTSNSKIT
jgi:hypothetical protein